MPKQPPNVFLPLRHLTLDEVLGHLAQATKALHVAGNEWSAAMGTVEDGMRRLRAAKAKAEAAATEIARAEDELRFRRQQGHLREYGKPDA